MAQTESALRALVALRGLTVNEVAERARLHRSRLSRLFHGKEPMTPQLRRRIERAIVADLIEEAPDDRPTA